MENNAFFGTVLRNLGFTVLSTGGRVKRDEEYCGGNEWVCRRSARSSGQQVGQRTSSKQNPQKKQLYSVSVKKALSKDPYIVCKFNLYP